MSASFDPFSDRLARDIRNSLSVALAGALTSGDGGDMEKSAARWLAAHPPAACRRYIADRLQRYREVLSTTRQGPAGAVDTARLLWNRRLFFEAHEVLEGAWQAAGGNRREALKGLIQAAGVFVHLESGNEAAAQRLAARARGLLNGRGRHLPEIANLEALVESLKNPLSGAPQLTAPGSRGEAH